MQIFPAISGILIGGNTEKATQNAKTKHYPI